MSKYQTIFTEHARADLRKIDRVQARSILLKLGQLENDPYGFDTTALVDRPSIRRLRVGDWCVFYEVLNKRLIIHVVSGGTSVCRI